MLQNKTILTLTIDLLANGAFSHLKDDEITAMHHLILRLKEPLSSVQQNILIAFWYHADISGLSPSLLYRCNTVLQQHGRNPLEEISIELEVEY